MSRKTFTNIEKAAAREMRRQGLSREIVAVRFGVTTQTIWNWERAATQATDKRNKGAA